MSKGGQNLTRCYRYVLCNNLVLAVPKMGQLSESGTLPDCKMVLVTRYFAILVRAKKILVLLRVPKMGQMS